MTLNAEEFTQDFKQNVMLKPSASFEGSAVLWMDSYNKYASSALVLEAEDEEDAVEFLKFTTEAKSEFKESLMNVFEKREQSTFPSQMAAAFDVLWRKPGNAVFTDSAYYVEDLDSNIIRLTLEEIFNNVPHFDAGKAATDIVVGVRSGQGLHVFTKSVEVTNGDLDESDNLLVYNLR